MSYITDIVGSRIRAKRLDLNLTQEQVAEKANLHPTYIGQVERGEKNATIDSIFKICIALDYPLEQLFEKIIISTKEESKIPFECFSLIAKQSKKDQESLFSIINEVLSIKGP